MTPMVENVSAERAITLGHPSYVWRAGQERRLEMIRSHVPLDGARILDVGCGLGMYVRRFRAFSDDVHGVDVDAERVAAASQSLPNIRQAPAEALPYDDDTFDMVLLHEVLEHVDEDAAALAEAHRVTRPGGRIVVFVPNRWYPFETHGFFWRGRYRFGNIPLVNYLPDPLRNRLCPHVRAYTLIHAVQPDATVTIAHHLRDFAPMNPRNPLHRAFTRLNQWAFNDVVTDAFGLGRFTSLLGRSPLPEGRYADVIGLNYYSRTAVTGPSDGVFPGVPVNDLGWEIWPQGLVTCARSLHERLGVPVWITENGCADNGSATELERFRPRFLAEHLGAILDSGLPIERYYHWCFVDNWEWAEGEVQRFGIVHNDYETQTRTVKPSGRMLAEVVAEGALTPSIIEQYSAGQEYPRADGSSRPA